MPFIDKQFPKHLGYGSRPIPGYDVLIRGSSVGYESRNARQEQSRTRVEVRYGPRKDTLIEDALYFFHEMGGSENSFRFQNPFDYKSGRKDAPVTNKDVQLVPEVQGGDPVNGFQLFKLYQSVTVDGRRKDITKPVTDTVLLVDIRTSDSNETPLVEGVDFTIDYLQGLITLTVDMAIGHELWGGFEYDLPVRMFVSDFPIDLTTYKHSGLSFSLIEVLDEPRRNP